MYSINSIDDSIDLAKVRYAYAGMFAFLGPTKCVFLFNWFTGCLFCRCLSTVSLCTICCTNHTVLVLERDSRDTCLVLVMVH